ncbi:MULTISPECIES: YeeE/YedE family protein [unclassified Modicisalibacter]|uniref:YeeE/YedE family protein n=1 Tax=unclassified Modicisalibacter TaxID=2679913 RepID=UPI001CC90680|nr:MULTISPECIES: YeeE/YedE family protein [unclassified Modicisalibacter]MBZ9559100.1 YeeE/YedE family protein [Modicisalibacter sp. R2A 31.J]MBZ9576789.1 YeeE/YedE family protein [Modicisalibacter sp. MOD 31.J]
METMSAFQGLLGGVLIGLAATLLMGLLGRIAGISGIFSGLLFERGGNTPWRVAFLLGIVSGTGLLILTGLDWGNVAGDGEAVVGAPASGLTTMLIAGLLVGLGTGLGSGCTSGHGVCGLARLSPRSLAATLVFVLVAMLTVFVSRPWLGGAP